MGFPTRFVQMVKVTHAATTFRFRVNGFLSRPVPVGKGIRQGCPMAPLLFILAIEPFARRIFTNQRIQGVKLLLSDKELKLATYADDTTLYLHKASCLPECARMLDEFACLSGLRVNSTKSVAVWLDQQCSRTQVGRFSCLKAGEWIRYLGIIFGRSDMRHHNWQVALKSIRTRLGIATTKLLTASQRSAFSSAIIVPKIAFIARHVFPTSPQCGSLSCLIDNCIWSGTARDDRREKVAALGRELAIAKRSQGGLGRPDLKTSLVCLAAKAVVRLCFRPPSLARDAQLCLIRDFGRSGLLSSVSMTAPCAPPGTVRFAGNLWTTGLRTVRCFLSEHIYNCNSARRESGIRYAGLQSLLGSTDLHWEANTLIVDCRKYSRQWKKDCDSWDPRWIVRCPLALLKDPAHCHFVPNDEFPPFFFRGCKSIGDITTLRWENVGVIAFIASKRASLYPTLHSSAFSSSVFSQRLSSPGVKSLSFLLFHHTLKS